MKTISSFFFQNTKNVIEFKNSILIFFSSPFPKLVDEDFNTIRNLHTPLPFDSAKAVVLDSFWIGQDPYDPHLINALNVYTETIRSIDFTSLFDTIEDIQVNGGSLFIKGHTGDSNKVVELNELLEISQVHELDLLPVIKDVTHRKSVTYRYSSTRVYSHHTDGLGAYDAEYRICYQYLDPQPVEYVNIRLDSMWIKSIILHAFYAEIEVAFQVTNLSSDILHSFTLHYDNNEPENTCFNGTNALHFEDVNVNPGNQLILDYSGYTTAFTNGGPLSRQYFVEHGNHHLDSDTSNNSFKLIHFLSSVDEQQQIPYNVFPNPFTHFLTTTFSGQEIEMKLFDQMGNLVVNGSKQLDDLDNLPLGIYFLLIQMGNQFRVEKVVKVE